MFGRSSANVVTRLIKAVDAHRKVVYASKIFFERTIIQRREAMVIRS